MFCPPALQPHTWYIDLITCHHNYRFTDAIASLHLIQSREFAGAA